MPIEQLIAETGLAMQRGHPCLYDALVLATRYIHPTSYLEIGVCDGASLLTVLRSAPIDSLVLCDTWQTLDGGSGRGSHDHIARLLSTVGYIGNVRFLDGDSSVQIPTLGPEWQFDLITVDGCHDASPALTDLENVWPHLRRGGILVFDDTDRPHLKEVWRGFQSEHGAEFIFEITDSTNGTLVMRKPA